MANLTSTTITGDLTVTGSTTGVGFSSGTKMVFYQASAPTGWTKDTASGLSDASFRVTTGTGGGTGGSNTFQTVFTSSKTTDTKNLPVSGSVSVSGSVGNCTLSTPIIASHVHNGCFFKGCRDPGATVETLDKCATRVQDAPLCAPLNIGRYPAGGGGAHAHPLSVSGSLSGATAPNASFSVPSMNLKYANVIIAAKN